MPIIRRVEVSEGIDPIPADIYQAVLADINEGIGQYGNYLRLGFEITNGVYKGTKRSLLTSDRLRRTPNGKSKLLKILETLEGGEIEDFLDLNIEGFLGKRCRIILQEPTIKDGITYQNISEVIP